jgi:glycerol-3-phosphate responsive antiterminator
VNLTPIKTEKTLKPEEEIIKTLLEELLKLFVNLKKIRNTKSQQIIVANVINALKNRKRTFTFQDLFNTLLYLIKNAKSKENIAISSRLFKLCQDAYKNALKK